jgi:hypothetical protein
MLNTKLVSWALGLFASVTFALALVAPRLDSEEEMTDSESNHAGKTCGKSPSLKQW